MSDTETFKNHRVLIADDESVILRVCAKILEKNFKVDTAESGEKGLDMVQKKGPYAVIIADLCMPGMDGMQFLSKVKKIAPESEFIIQTGYAERNTIIKAVKDLAVSRILVKPCDRKTLFSEVNEAVARYAKRVSEEIQEPAFKKQVPSADPDHPIIELVLRIVGNLKVGQIRLPVLPQIVQELQVLEKNPKSTVTDLSEIIEKDAVISLEVVKAAGSYLYRGRKEIRTVREAIPRLGIKETINIVTTITNKAFYEVKNHRLRSMMEKLWLHSLCCAYCAKTLAERLKMENFEKYHLMGLLHDIGKVLILRALDDKYKPNSGIDMRELIDSLQEPHTGVGGILLRHWRFPKEFISVATLHEDPLSYPLVNRAVFVVHIANLLARKIGYSLFAEDIDLNSLAAAEKLDLDSDSLKEACQTVMRQMQGAVAG